MSLDPDIRRLAQQIEHHNRLYWELNTPEISDHAYDALVEELRRLDPKHPSLIVWSKRLSSTYLAHRRHRPRRALDRR